MPRAIYCKHCGSADCEATAKDTYRCRKCNRITVDKLDPMTKTAVRSVIGFGLSVLTFGLLPEEVQDSLLDGAEDMFS